jgi:hypothetical protein
MEPDFSDCQFYGVYKWVDLDVAIDMLPEKEAELRDSLDNFGGTDTVAQQDAEKNWFDSRLERVKLIECWYKQRGKWRFAIYTGSQILKEGVSPWLDDRGKTRSRYNMGSAGIDQDGDRYGFYRNMKWQQDEINHRRSKLLWMMNVNQAFVERGGVDDPDKLRDDLARPDSVIEYNPNGLGHQAVRDPRSEPADGRTAGAAGGSQGRDRQFRAEPVAAQGRAASADRAVRSLAAAGRHRAARAVFRSLQAVEAERSIGTSGATCSSSGPWSAPSACRTRTAPSSST